MPEIKLFPARTFYSLYSVDFGFAAKSNKPGHNINECLDSARETVALLENVKILPPKVKKLYKALRSKETNTFKNLTADLVDDGFVSIESQYDEIKNISKDDDTERNLHNLEDVITNNIQVMFLVTGDHIDAQCVQAIRKVLKTIGREDFLFVLIQFESLKASVLLQKEADYIFEIQDLTGGPNANIPKKIKGRSFCSGTVGDNALHTEGYVYAVNENHLFMKTKRFGDVYVPFSSISFSDRKRISPGTKIECDLRKDMRRNIVNGEQTWAAIPSTVVICFREENCA